jgi:hypothetical protein
MTHDEIAAYIETDEWRQRCRELRVRQEAGEVLSFQQMAAALKVPKWFIRASRDHLIKLMIEKDQCQSH